MKKNSRFFRGVEVVLLIMLICVNAVGVYLHSADVDILGGDSSGEQEQIPITRITNISGNISQSGMSLNAKAPAALELGISECDVYCLDKFQLVPLCGTGVKYSSSNEEIASVDENGLVSTYAAGNAVITATDSSGNTDTCTINVIKVAYITIDDTPTEFTAKTLDILDQYGVKATFFMNASVNAADMYREIYERGHTFALHGYKHRTSYADGADFVDNMEQARQFIMEASGCDSIDNLIRFPTGTKGMEKYRSILEYVLANDYSVFDWTTEFHDYYYHTASGCLEYFKTYLTTDRAVVLFHMREWSVEALPEALEYMIDQGYTFATITRDTAQHNFYKYYG